MPESVLVILTSDTAVVAKIVEMLTPFGWDVRACAEPHSLVGLLADTLPAAIILDTHGPAATAAAFAVRQLDPPTNGTPIIAIGPDDGNSPANAGHLDGPFEGEAFLKLLVQRTGALDDHHLRALPWTPRYKLIRLLGMDGADALLGRLRDTLRDVIAAGADGAHLVGAHRLAGLAGMCGFEDLSRAWADAERHSPGALGVAIDASRDVVAQLDRVL